MTRPTAPPAANAPPAAEPPYVQALAAGHLDPLRNDPAARLLDQMRHDQPANDVSLESAALRLILYRLLIEHHDLPSLVPLVTRVVIGAIQAARLRRALDGHGAEQLLAAINTILDEIHPGQS